MAIGQHSGHDGPRGPKPKRGIEGRRVRKVLRAERMPGPSKRGEQPSTALLYRSGNRGA